MKQRFITEEQFDKLYDYTVEWNINSPDSEEVLVRVFNKGDNKRGTLPVWSMTGHYEEVEQELKFRFNIIQYVNGNTKTRIKKSH